MKTIKRWGVNLMSQINSEEMSQTILKKAKELVEAINQNKQLFETLKDAEEDIEILRLIAKEMEVFHEIMRDKKLTAEEIADEIASIKYTARLEMTIDRREVAVFAPSGTLILRVPLEDARGLTIEQIMAKPFMDLNALNHLYERFIEKLNIVTKELLDKFEIVEKINMISDWLDKNDP